MVQLQWQGDLRFSVAAGDGPDFNLDSESATGPSPMDALLAALGGCMGIDVVDILIKMRQPLKGLRLELSGERNSDPPKYFTSVNIMFYIRGEIEPDKADRAVALSFEKYCSVLHTLRFDLEVSHRIELSP